MTGYIFGRPPFVIQLQTVAIIIPNNPRFGCNPLEFEGIDSHESCKNQRNAARPVPKLGLSVVVDCLF